MNIALFDLDHTLLPIDSDFTWALFTNSIGWTDADESLKQNDIFYQQYVDGVLDMNEYVRFVTRAIRAHTPEEARAAHNRYLAEFIEPQVRAEALDLLRSHQQAGDTLVLASASLDVYVEPIARRLGFDLAVATRMSNGCWLETGIADPITDYADWIGAVIIQDGSAA